MTCTPKSTQRKNQEEEVADSQPDDEIEKIQTQQIAFQNLSKIPVVVHADPKIIIKGTQPSFQIMENTIN